MTHKYLYIECGNILDETAKFYLVYVGTSQQANRDYLFLTAYSVEHGHFFELNSRRVADFLDKVRCSLPCMAQPIAVSSRELVRHFRNGTRPSLSAAQLANYNHVMTYLNLNYRSAHPRP